MPSMKEVDHRESFSSAMQYQMDDKSFQTLQNEIIKKTNSIDS